MPVTIGRSLRALLLAIKSRRNFEFTIFNNKSGSLVNFWAISQVSNDIRVEVSLELMFRTLRDARLSLSSREFFTQILKWLTGYMTLVGGGKDWLRTGEVGVWCRYDIWRGQTLLVYQVQ